MQMDDVWRKYRAGDVHVTERKEGSGSGTPQFHSVERTEKKGEREEELLRRLDETEEKMVRADKNYAEMWRKHQRSQERVIALQAQLQINIQENSHLKHTVAQLTRHSTSQSQSLSPNNLLQREGMKEWLAEIERLQSRLLEADRARKALADQLILLRSQHEQEVCSLKQSHGKIEGEYLAWVQQCNSDRLRMRVEYEKKLIQMGSRNQAQQLVYDHQADYRRVTENKQAVTKQSSLQYSSDRLEELTHANTALRDRLAEQEMNNSQLSLSLQNINQQFIALKDRIATVFADSESLKALNQHLTLSNQQLQRKCSTLKQETMEIMEGHHRKEEQKMKGMAAECGLNGTLTELVYSLKNMQARSEEEKGEMQVQLYAARLECASLRQQLQDCKVDLRREYELSIENTRHELESQIEAMRWNHMDEQKEQLYLKIRKLERDYELLASEVVTVDDMMGIAAKVHKRHSVLRRL